MGGGLNDTVFDIDHDKERCGWYGYDTNGFSFEGTDSEALDYALNRAIDAYYDARDWFRSLQLRCLEQDFTWNRPALEYMEVRMLVRKEKGWHVMGCARDSYGQYGLERKYSISSQSN